VATALCVMQKTIDKYVGLLCEARKKKGLTEQQARDNLQDINVYGTLMVLAGDADGMVSGATTTTANTIRPALQVCMACYCFLKFHMACSQTDCPLFFLTSLFTFSAFVFAWLLRLVMPATGRKHHHLLATDVNWRLLVMEWSQEPSQPRAISTRTAVQA
jgi:hypothetical protein